MYEQVCIATPRDEYYLKMLETLIDHNDRHNAPLSIEKLRQAVIIVMVETEEKERDAAHNANNMTMDTFFNHSTISLSQGEIKNGTSVHYTISPPYEDANVTNERRIASDTLKETIQKVHGLTIQPTISNSVYYDSEEHNAVSDPKSDSLLDTHTSDGKERKISDTDTTNSKTPHKLILNRLIPNTISGAIRPIDQTITEDVAGIRETLDARQTVLSKEIVTDAARSGACILRTPREVSRTGRDSTMPQDRNTAVADAMLNSPVQI